MSLFSNFLDGGAGEAQKKNEANASWLKQEFGGAKSLGQTMLMKALAGLDTGYTNASNELSKAGETATTQILGQGKQALAAGQQSLINSGFSGSIGAQLPGQVAAQTNQSLAGLGEALGAQKANLATNYANSKFSATQNFASWLMGSVNTASAITPQYQAAGPGFLGAFGESLGNAAGSWLSNPASFGGSGSGPAKPKVPGGGGGVF